MHEAQKKAAAVSARNRSRRAQEKRDRDARRAAHIAEHARDNFDGFLTPTCPHCAVMVEEWRR